ncbi:soma ferritin [Lingula anatina]|uniref:Ferritin n=1 Tax=Lingula anatina TaxID=7574 RepID=A0A2R2MT57_LINAN|nr:soma ferritin [Lingula anatina]|eukprot:XP_023933434.1 soma ferritin [Lingula anatina]
MAVSQPRQNYAVESEAGVNKQINMELYASYVYHSMAYYFDRDDVALPGFHKFFKKASEEEREHAEKLMKFQNQRGGRIVLQDIRKPEKDEWGDGLAAMQVALALEKNVNQALLDLHKVAADNGDAQAYYFDRDDVALPGFHKFFKKASEEEREHAEKLMKFQNQRGGRIVLQDIRKPEKDEWGDGLAAMQVALALEKNVNQALLDLHKVAADNGDAQMTDFIEGHYLTEQVESIKQISDHITNLKRCGKGLGEYMFDKETLQD